MKTEDLRSRGLTEDQIDFIMSENGKDLNKLRDDIKNLTAERDTLKGELDTAKDTLNKFDGIDVAGIQNELTEWKKKAAEAEAEAKRQLYERDFNDALKSELNSVRFTSDAAKRDVTAQITAAGLKLKDGKILGLSDLLEQIRKADAAAFVDEQQERLEENKARFTAPQNPRSGVKSGRTNLSEMTLDERMRLKASDPSQYDALKEGV